MAVSEKAALPNILAQIISPERQDLYRNLYEGLRHRRDHITLRTLLLDVKTILGVPKDDAPWQPLHPEQLPAAKALLESLTAGTYSAPLIPELLYSLGFSRDQVLSEIQTPPLDFLLVSGRFLQDPLFFDLADALKAQSHSVAAINPVGTYNDGQRRVMGLSTLLRPVDHMVILASTQTEGGGSVEVLENVIRTLKNPAVARRVKAVTVAIPMFGGSRGHRLSQAEQMGFEIFEAESSAKDLCHTTQKVLNSLRQQGLADSQLPRVRFVSIDIHNLEQPGVTFANRNFEFVSASPASEFADSVYYQLSSYPERDLLSYPLKLFACDEGAVPRTQELARELLHHRLNHLRSIDVVYIKKIRKVAGKVEKAWIDKVEQWTLTDDGSISIQSASSPSPENPSDEECVLALTDDMVDTCITAGDDTQLAQTHFPHHVYTLFIATHPVLSKGPQKLNLISADFIILGNTLPTEDLTHVNGIKPKVRLIDLAPTLAHALTT